MAKSDLTKNDNSKGLIIDYYSGSAGRSTPQFGRKADFNLTEALKIIKNDPVVKGAIISLCDKIMETPFQVVGKDKRSKKKEVELMLRELRFEKTLRKVIFNMLLYGNAFIEIVKKDGKVTDLNVLESTFMEIVAKDNGDIEKYQQVQGNDDRPISWDADRIVHFTLTEITSNVWGEVDIESLYDTVLIKDYIRQWMQWFFKTNQSRGFYNIENASEQKVKDFLSLLKANEVNYGLPVIAQGKVSYQVLRSFADEGKSLNDVLLWANTEILALLQVPPIVVGFPDMSGRANSSEQQKSLNTRVNSIQKNIEEFVTYDLFPKIGYDKVLFEFGALDDAMMKQKMEVLVMMKNAGFTNDAMIEWLKEQDIYFDTEKVFNEPEDFMFGEDRTVTDQDESAPSRQRKGEGEANKQKDEPSTREDQLMKNTYPDFIEPTDQYKEFEKE